MPSTIWLAQNQIISTHGLAKDSPGTRCAYLLSFRQGILPRIQSNKLRAGIGEGQ
jgi:hypothetical protein